MDLEETLWEDDDRFAAIDPKQPDPKQGCGCGPEYNPDSEQNWIHGMCHITLAACGLAVLGYPCRRCVSGAVVQP
jgi:hypothetical protein